MFATDDITQKMIIANNKPEEFPHLVATVFSTKKQKSKKKPRKLLWLWLIFIV